MWFRFKNHWKLTEKTNSLYESINRSPKRKIIVKLFHVSVSNPWIPQKFWFRFLFIILRDESNGKSLWMKMENLILNLMCSLCSGFLFFSLLQSAVDENKSFFGISIFSSCKASARATTNLVVLKCKIQKKNSLNCFKIHLIKVYDKSSAKQLHLKSKQLFQKRNVKKGKNNMRIILETKILWKEEFKAIFKYKRNGKNW